ncbi:endonuclease III [Lactococcus hircilactis]|uniref:Endonuclease III n=1 Tax=Lactococcus hircilactis TaxID=1494462 RepID=A0A7X1Z7G9_9LACT|nr:endonuclease III [Lactococcus hircilactis]MQW39191.1 endonuclease III [Lactococcus hircilactis]
MLSKKRFLEALAIIFEMFPEAKGELHSKTPFQLLIATILSAQATDKGVNKATPALFSAYPDAKSLAVADISSIESKIKSIGLFHTKAKNIKAAAKMLMEDFDGELPKDKVLLQKLPGVGRKTANVVLGDAYGIPGIAVDTHLDRIAKRLNIVPQKASVLDVEKTLMRYIPEEKWVTAHHHLIFFGRYHCTAKNPNCENCPVLSYCKFGQERLGGFDA